MARKPRSAGLNGAIVLVVEDDFMIFLGLELTLANAHARAVVHCPTVAKARTFMANHVPRPRGGLVAILDVRLDGETSQAFAHELKQLDVPFLFYSGEADWSAIRREFPETPLLTKPALPEVMVRTLADLLQKSGSRGKRTTRRAR